MLRFSGLRLSKRSLVHIAALCTLGIAHPLYELLSKGDHATFFIAHESKAIDVYIFVLALSVVLPLLLYSLVALLNVFSQRFARALYAVVLTALFILLFLLVFENLSFRPVALTLVLPVLTGVIASLLFISWPYAQSALSIMSVAVILSPLMFLGDQSIRTFLSTPEAQDYSLIAEESKLPNVVMIIFDELPLTSLLDENRLIDDVRYPNFARLAERSHWFRNATTTHYSSRIGAVPSILTGLYPSTYRERSPEMQTNTSDPIQKQNMPESIFTLLQTTHRILAVESMTKLAPENELTESTGPAIRERLLILSCDALVVYGHLITPQGFKSELPTVHGQWRDFCTFRNARPQPSPEWPYVDAGSPATVKRFIELLDSSQESSFYFLHALLPHFPFKYDANGEVLEDQLDVMSGVVRWATGKNNWPNETVANLAYQAHLIQLMFTDRLLGHVLDRLEVLGIFDRSMIIVTADHGTTFYWDSAGVESSELKRIQASDTMYVPFFIKMPDQENGLVSDRQVETIDIIPTLASALGLEPSWEPDGISVFSEKESNRDRIAMIPYLEKFGKDIDPGYSSLKRKLQLFGSRNLDGLYLIGPDPELVGQAVSSFSLVESQEEARFAPSRYQSKTSGMSRVNAYVEGSLSNEENHFDVNNTRLAIAVNGNIVNTALSTSASISEFGEGIRSNGQREIKEDGNVHFLARIPLNKWREGMNDISVHVIRDDDDNRVSLISFSADP